MDRPEGVRTIAAQRDTRISLPRELRVFRDDVYLAERGIDGALLLTRSQQAEIAGWTESLRKQEWELNSRTGAASGRDAAIDAAKALAVHRAEMRESLRFLVQPVLTAEQKSMAASIDAAMKAAVSEVDNEFNTRFSSVTGEARAALEKVKPEMVLATFQTKLDAMLSDAQRDAISDRAIQVQKDLVALKVEVKRQSMTREYIAQLKAARQRAEEERRASQSRNFGVFNANATGHDWANAYLLAFVSNLVYPGEVGMTSNFDDQELFEDQFTTRIVALGVDAASVDLVSATEGAAVDAEAVVFATDSAVIVVFRGSESETAEDIGDWLTNANAFFTKLGDVRGYPSKGAVHSGVWSANGRIYSELKGLVSAQARSGKKVWITGHSLGGAMATLFAGRYIRDGGSVQGLVTFASPRCTNGAFGSFVKNNVKVAQRWVNKNDLVPMVPPDWDLEPLDDYTGDNGIYAHFGRTAQVLRNDRIDLDASEFRGVGSADEHSMRLYCRAIRREMPATIRDKMPPAPPAP